MPKTKMCTESSSHSLGKSKRKRTSLHKPENSQLKYKQLKIITFCIPNKELEIPQKENKSTMYKDNTSSIQKPKDAKFNKAHTTKLSKPKKTEFKRSSSGSFEKYGVCLPNFEDVLEYQKKVDQEKLLLENLVNEISEPIKDIDITVTEPVQTSVILDCKHLTKGDISKLFSANLNHVKGILHEIIFSKRHEQFIKQNSSEHFTAKDLKYNTSMITFTFEQKKQLLHCLRKEFGHEALCKNDQYFFKVLLPELCLKIFMDVHNMSNEVAVSYLDIRPIVDV